MLLQAKEIVFLPGTRLEVTHGFEQAPVKEGLGKVPRHLQPAPASIAR